MASIIKPYLLMYNVSQVLGWFYLNYIALPFYKEILDTGRQSTKMYHEIKQVLTLLLLIPYLEVIHAMTGIVKSSPVPTITQVTARAFVFIVICGHYECIHSSIQFSTMILAWNMSEIIRYSYYAINLMGIPVGVMTWLRYSLFIVLYPMGAGSEFLCMMKALPDIKKDQERNILMPNKFNITFNFYYMIIFFMFLYLPLFPQLYGHMLRQRKKILGRQAHSDLKKGE